MTLAQRIREKAKLSGEFTLRSGAVSDTYFDKYLFESDPVLLKEIALNMADMIPPDTEVLAGLEMGGIPVVTALSQVTALPAAFIRKKRKEHGTQKYAEGADLRNKRVLIVEDVVSSGGAILDALAMLKSDGIEPIKAICVIDRETGGTEALQERGVLLQSLFTMSEIENA